MKNFEFNGKLYGLYIIYFWNGNIMKKCYYKDNKLEGEYILYYESGNLYYKCYYKNGKKRRKIYSIL